MEHSAPRRVCGCAFTLRCMPRQAFAIDLVIDVAVITFVFFFFSSRRRHTRCSRDWSSDVCSSDLFGTIGTAPYGKECISSLVPGTHGANMDFNEVVEGVTMYFPVFEPGALFMIGEIGRASCRERV